MADWSRRSILAGFGGLFASQAGLTSSLAGQNAWSFSFENLEGKPIRLSDWQGHPIMIVNTASQCGFVGQFAGLQQIYTRFEPRGFKMLAIPSNDFGGQEPGGKAEIIARAEGEYHVTFPIAAKASVKGSDAHPFYQWAASRKPAETPRWNFHKYLIGKNGDLVAAFSTMTDPTDSRVIGAIVSELGES